MRRHDPPVFAHHLLADGSSTALVLPDGEVDWWCAPEPDSPPIAWSLLDPAGGTARWLDVEMVDLLGPVAGPTSHRIVRHAGGRIECWDGLRCRDDRGSALVRLVRALDGELDLVHEVRLGGFDQPVAQWHVGDDGVRTTLPFGEALVCGGTSEVVHDGTCVRTTVRVSCERWASVVVSLDPTRAGEDDPAPLLAELEEAEREVERLASRSVLPNELRHRAADALSVLSACTYDKTGAVFASPTTSLPEAPGHDRQFDYRYSWLRDSSLAVSVAALLGRGDIADRYLAFVVRQTQVRQAPSGPMTDVRGETVPEEREIPGIRGWAGSQPVRVGNAARTQVQWDAIGMLVEAVSVYLQLGGVLRRDLWELVRDLADAAVRRDVDAPSHGIWEFRDARKLVDADIGAWLALDRAVWIARIWRPTHRRRRWIAARAQAADRVLAAIGPDGGLPQAYDQTDDRRDASALMVPLFRMLDRRDPRAHRLIDATFAALKVGPFLYRYPPGESDGFSGREGAFLPMSWWAVSALAVSGRLDEARRLARELDRALPRLMPEEIEPLSRQGLGNVPLVWSHMEAARAAYLLDAAAVRARWGPVGMAVVQFARYLHRRTRRPIRAG